MKGNRNISRNSVVIFLAWAISTPSLCANVIDEVKGKSLVSPLIAGAPGKEMYCIATITDAVEETGSTPGEGILYYYKATGTCSESSWVLSGEYTYNYEPGYTTLADRSGVYPLQNYCSLMDSSWEKGPIFHLGLHTLDGTDIPITAGVKCEGHPDDDYYPVNTIKHSNKGGGTLVRQTPPEVIAIETKGIPRTRVLRTEMIYLNDGEEYATLVRPKLSIFVPSIWATGGVPCVGNPVRVELYFTRKNPGYDMGVIEKWTIDSRARPGLEGPEVPMCTLIGA